MSIKSDIDTKLPAIPQIRDPEMNRELMKVYDAVRILQTEVSQLKARVKALEPLAK